MSFVKKKCSLKNKLLAGVLSIGVALCVGGCVPKEEWVLRCGDVTISSGEYVTLMVESLMNAKKQTGGDRDKKFSFVKNFKDKKIGSKSAFDWVKDNTLKQAEEWLLLKNEFLKNNFHKKKSVQNREKKSLDFDIDLEIAEANHEIAADKIGLTKEGLINKELNDVRSYSVLLNEFGKGKPRYVSEEKRREFIDQNFLKFKMVKLPKSIEDKIYCEMNDSNPGSKLEKKCEVKTPKELADKYMKQMADGGSIDDVIKSHNEFLGLSKDTQPKFTIACKISNEHFPETTEQELRNIVGELEVDSKPVLKENESFYFILQRFKLDEDDIKKNLSKAKSMLLDDGNEKYIAELKEKNRIEINEKVFQKYSVMNQAKIMDKNMPKRQNTRNSAQSMFDI